jgi:D-galactonate transporter
MAVTLHTLSGDRRTEADGEDTSIPASAGNSDQTFRRVALRLLPFLLFCYVFNYIDRVNISFAHLQFKSDLGLDDAAYGFGVGIFYLGYVLFEVPSNLLLRRIGARRTITRIMVLWGLVSLSMMFVTSTVQFYIARVALGIAEAGFFPGIIFYLSSWFPKRHHAKVMSMFVLGIALAGMTGGPLSGLILSCADGWQTMHAWQWLFFLEGIPPVLAGVIAWWYLPDSPTDAMWLTEDERKAIVSELSRDAELTGHPVVEAFGQALRNPLVYVCALGYFSITWAGSILNFWAPTIIHESGVSRAWLIGLISAIPYSVGAITMILACRHSDAKNERALHFAAPAVLAALGAALLGCYHGSFHVAIAALTLVSMGYLSCTAIFWTIPSTFLRGTASAGAVAFISSVGQLGSLTAPIAIGWLTSRTYDISAGAYLVAAVLICGAIVIALSIRRTPATEHSGTCRQAGTFCQIAEKQNPGRR